MMHISNSMMTIFLVIAQIGAAFSGILLLSLLVRKFRNESHFLLLLRRLLAFLLLVGASLSVVLVAQEFSLETLFRNIGLSLLFLIGASTWCAKSLLFEKSGHKMLVVLVVAGLELFSYLNISTGYFGATFSDNGEIAEIYLTSAGKLLFSSIVVLAVLFLSRTEILWNMLIFRFGRRGKNVAKMLLILMISTLIFASLSIVFWRISPILLAIVVWESTCLFIVLRAAFKNAPGIPALQTAPQLRLTYALSSGALIYGGIYLITFGLIVKLAIWIGGDWQLFVSFLAALGAVVLALILVSHQSLRARWKDFIDHNLMERRYDFRRELRIFSEAIAGDLSRDELIEIFCQTVRKIFRTKEICLLAKNEDTGDFDLYMPANKNNSAGSICLAPFQVSWLARMNESFIVDKLVQTFQQENAQDELARILLQNRLQWGVCLSAANCLLGVLFIGEKPQGKRFDREDRQLLCLLANAMSLELHRSNLRQIVHDAEQMESIYRVTSFIMHDLRNVVSTLSLLTQNAKIHLDKKPFRKDFIPTLDRASCEMLQLTDRLSSIKAGGEMQQLARCYPATMLVETIKDVQIPGRITVSTEIANLPAATWDENQIRVVLRNLLKNAVEAMPQNGTLEIRAKADAGWILFSIADSGVGMAQEFIRHRLFKPNQTTKSKGLGIGMYQSRKIVRMHKGEILVDSVPGKGTTMILRLPIHVGAESSSMGEMVAEREGERESWRERERLTGRNDERERWGEGKEMAEGNDARKTYCY